MELDTLLKKDRAYEKNWYSSKKMNWFHPGINRKSSETLLKNNDFFKKDGIFVVRNNYMHATEFVLSFTYSKKVAHYRITSPRPLHYSIEMGDVFRGLDKLIENQRENKGNLPTVLMKEVKGVESAPPLSLSAGYTNCLHTALRNGDADLAMKLIKHPKCPHLDAKDSKGCTALHIAVAKGMDAVVLLLIDKNATVEVPDAEGLSPLFRAVKYNHTTIVKHLITEGDANVQLREQQTGNVPLHEAAKRGHLECIQILLQQEASVWTRNTMQKTPYEMAVQYGHHQCSKYLDDYKPPEGSIDQDHFLHPNLDRRGALAMIENHGIKDGLFLVRKSSRPPGCYVLSTCFNGKAYHYEINMVSNHSGSAYYINRGPLFSSLSQLIQYYCQYADGIEGKLSEAMAPFGNKVKAIICNRRMEAQFMSKHMTPKVLESGRTEYTLASNIRRHNSTTSTDSSDYQLTGRQRTPSVFDKKLEGHILDGNSIELGYELGQGEFGSVVKGTWTRDGHPVDVAIKTLHEDFGAEGKATFLAEAEVMVSLSHPCIVHLVGVCEGPPLMLVQEHIQLGSLLDFLLDYPEKISVNKDFPLWAAQIASGMLYLERMKFVHRDLAARNILVQSKEQVKVGDFGLSRAVAAGEEVYKASKGGRWPVRWYAPESVNQGKFSSLTDVWSFGVTLWEMYSFGEQPYDQKTGSEVMAFIEQGYRLACPQQCPDKIYKVMGRCWRYDPSQRMTFKELLDFFNEVSDKTEVDLLDVIYVQSSAA